MLHKIVICIITALLLSVYFQNCKCTNILLVIEDNGCGIKASDLSRVFEKGFTGSNRNKANATGMGLYLSKKLCDRLGLKLDIASEYYGAAEPPVRCGESHLSGLTEPPHFVY